MKIPQDTAPAMPMNWLKRFCTFIELFSYPVVAILEARGCTHSSPPMIPSSCSRLVNRLKIDTYRLTVAMM